MADWQMFSRRADYRLSGGLPIHSAKGVIRHLGTDTAVIETPMTERSVARLAPGCGVVLNRDGRQMFSGLVGDELSISWSNDGAALVKAQLVGDNVHVADRLTLPDPTRAGDQQTTADRWSRTTVASTAMADLIARQLGPQARAERRVPSLYMGADPGVGAFRLWEGLFEPVLDTLTTISRLSGANLGIRIVWTPDGLRCDVHAARDRAAEVKFSADLGNLAAFDLSERTPSCTYALVAGQGDLRTRMRRAATSSAPLDMRWGRRIERYFDRRDEDDGAKLQQAADDEIANGVGQIALTCALTNSQAATLGRDWDLGDRITLYVGLPGQPKPRTVVDVVRQIEFSVDDRGAEQIRPAIGGADATTRLPTPTQQALAGVRSRLEGLVTRK